MIIELFGLPATGKTTIAKILDRDGVLPFIKIKNAWELLFLNVLFFYKHPIVAYKILFKTLNYRDFVNFFLYRNAKYEKATHYKKSLIDEGMFQNLLSVFKQPINQKKFLQLAQSLPKPDLLVILETTKEERERRINIRGIMVRQDRDYFYEEFMKILPQLNLNYLKINADNSEATSNIIKTHVANN